MHTHTRTNTVGFGCGLIWAGGLNWIPLDIKLSDNIVVIADADQMEHKNR